MKKILMAMIALTVISGTVLAFDNKKGGKAETKKECKSSCKDKKDCKAVKDCSKGDPKTCKPSSCGK